MALQNPTTQGERSSSYKPSIVLHSDWKMSSFDKVRPSLIPYYDTDFKEPSLTDEEAALVLLQLRTGIVPLPPSRHRGHGSGPGPRSQEPVHDGNISGTATHAYYDSDLKGPALTTPQMRTGINLLPASNHLQHESRSQSRKPMHNDNADSISDTTYHSNRNQTNAPPSQTINCDSDVTISDAPSNAGYPELSSQPIGYDLDVTISDAPSDADYSGLNENSAIFNCNDSDGTISDIASSIEYYGTGRINSSEMVDYDSDATISDPELDNKYEDNKYEYERKITSNEYQFARETIVVNDSDGTISDPELDNKDKYVHHNSGSLMIIGHDSNERISILQSNVEDPLESSTATPQSKGKRNKNTANGTDLRRPSGPCCSQCHEPGHNCRACPTIPCTYEGCNERGHVHSECPKLLTKMHESRNDWQRAYTSRKRKAAANVDHDSIMTHKRNKGSKKMTTGGARYEIC